MKRSGFKRPEPSGGFKSSFARKTILRKTAMKTRAKKRAPQADREHMGVVAGLFCVVCRNLRLGDSPAEVHHVRFLAGAGQRSGNFDTIPLCPPHHRIGGYGIAIHAGRETWELKFGTEADLLAQIKRETGLQEVECVS